MKKMMLIFALILCGCAAKPAHQAQIEAAIAGADSLQAGIKELKKDVAKACNGQFASRFAALEKQADSLQVQIASISPAAKADIAICEKESEKRGIIILGLLAALAILGYAFIKKAGIKILR